MGYLHELKKKMLRRQMELANKAKARKEIAVRKQIEIQQLRNKVKDAKKLDLTPSERAFYAKQVRRKKEAQERRKKELASFVKTAKQVGGQLQRTAVMIGNDLNKSQRPRKRKRKKTTTKRRRRRKKGY